MNFKDKLNGILKKKGFIPLTLKYFAGLVVTSVLIVGTNIAFFFEPEINSFLVQPIIDNTGFMVLEEMQLDLAVYFQKMVILAKI